MEKPASESGTSAASRGEGLLALWDLCRHLRGPAGCPWDREQTLASLTPYVVEETYEILESVSHDDLAATAEELGDLLFLLIFLAEMVEERGGPGLDALARAAREKLIRRHPHLFEAPEEISSGDQQRRWQRLKQVERGSKSVLGQMPAGLPSLTAAFRTQEKAASVGFDWPRVEEVADKVQEELEEVRAEISRREKGREALAGEIGDLLFAAANLSRYLRVDPERELRAAVLRFRQRFLHIEEALRERGSSPSESTLEEMDALWEEAKARERREEP
jgi:tetrapyrrole methylase family protein/MazG family protein